MQDDPGDYVDFGAGLVVDRPPPEATEQAVQREELDAGPRYRVMRLTLAPGAALASHVHRYRREVWTVLSGQAVVAVGCKTYSGFEGDTIEIPYTTPHSLTAAGDTPLVVLETQYGPIVTDEDEAPVTS